MFDRQTAIHTDQMPQQLPLVCKRCVTLSHISKNPAHTLICTCS